MDDRYGTTDNSETTTTDERENCQDPEELAVWD